MRAKVTLFLLLALCAPLATAQIAPETVGNETLQAPGKNWFLGKSWGAGYIFDADTGEMQGLLSLSGFTSAVAVDHARRQIYAPESYYSRGVHGERSDVLAIYDFDNLSPIAEIDIPDKIAALPFPRHVGLLNDGRHMLVFNLTPAQSVTVVDVEDRTFVGDLSTPGCAMIMPVQERDFLMICGDGTLQLIQLAEDGSEANRARSDTFFDVLEDPIFDRPVKTANGWLLTAHSGRALEVTVDGDDIEFGEEWSLVDEEQQDAGWRPGGWEFISVHEATGLTYVLMHQAEEEYTHHDPGSEIWVLNARQRRYLETIELEVPASSLYVTQSDEPKLLVADEEGGVHVFDAISLSLDLTIEDPGPGFSYFRGF